MKESYEVRITQYPDRRQQFTTTAIYKTYNDALEYAQLPRTYKCRIRIVHVYEAEETLYDNMSV